MNKQEIFDKVIQHARVQKKQAIDPLSGYCQYRAPDGLKCFVGCLIPDEKYEPYMEGISVSSVYILGAIGIPKEQRTQENIKFLRKLQVIHDIYNTSEWERKFQSFAEKYELTYNPPDNKS